MNGVLTEVFLQQGLTIEKQNYSVFGDSAVSVEGHNGLKHFSSESIVVMLGKKFLTVEGKDLTIKQLSKDFALVTGKILKVESL